MLIPSLAVCLAAAVVGPAQEVPAEKLLWTLPAEYPEEGFRAYVAPGTLRVVAHVEAGGGTLVLLDGEPQGEAHRYVNPPAFSADGAHVAWSFGDPSGRRKETWRIVVDGKESKKFDWAGAVTLDAEGEAVAWVGKGVQLSSEGVYEDGDYFLQQGRKKVSDEFLEAPPELPQLLPDGRLAYTARSTKGFHVVHGKKELGPYWWATSLAVSRDGKRVIWAGIGGGGESSRDPLAGLGRGGRGGLTRIHDGEQDWGAAYRGVGGPALGGPAGARLAYLGRTEDGIVVVLDDLDLEGTWDAVGTPVFSPDGARLACTANLGNKAMAGTRFLSTAWMDGAEVLAAEQEVTPSVCFLVVDGERQAGDWQRAILPVWSADGSTVAYRAQSSEGWHVVAGQAASEAFDEVGVPLLAADGSSVGFAARKGREVWWKVLGIPAAPAEDEAAPVDPAAVD